MAQQFEGIEDTELVNDIVTISMLQVALQADSPWMQIQVEVAAAGINRASTEGLFELLHQTSRSLLDCCSYWTHVLARSETVPTIDAAEQLYNQLLQRELTRTFPQVPVSAQKVSGKPVSLASDFNPPSAYIVVTLLLCTTNDQPLFGDVYSASTLRDVLSDIRTRQSRTMLLFDVLWAPQNPREPMTKETLEAAYSDMMEIG